MGPPPKIGNKVSIYSIHYVLYHDLVFFYKMFRFARRQCS